MTTDLDRAWATLAALAADAPDAVRGWPVAPPVDPVALRDDLARRYRFDAPVPLDRLTAEVSGLLRDGTVHVTHPRYFGLFNPSVHGAAVVADALAAVYNPQLAAWSHAPAAAEIERLTLRRLAEAVGLGAEHATFTSGGAESNLSAVLAALAHLAPEAATGGLSALPERPALYLTAESHHSFVKAARTAGLGTDALREVPTGPAGRFDVGALRRRLAADAADGWRPLLVVGTAGTTGAGLVDPLDALADAAADHGAWFHVDAAWGASYALVTRLRPLFDGIGRADSVTWDAHKGLSVPMGAGMFFCRHADAVRRAFAASTSCMPDAVATAFEDPYGTTAQWSRRAIGLKVFMALAARGLGGVAADLDRQAALGDRLRRRLADAGWAVVNDTGLPVVCFTHPALRAGRPSAAAVATRVERRGRAWVSTVAFGGEPVLRACVTSFRSAEDDVDALVDEVERARRQGAESEGPRRDDRDPEGTP